MQEISKGKGSKIAVSRTLAYLFVDQHSHQPGPRSILRPDAPSSTGALDMLKGEVELGLNSFLLFSDNDD